MSIWDNKEHCGLRLDAKRAALPTHGHGMSKNKYKKQTDMITEKFKSIMWEKDLFVLNYPQLLLNTMLYQIGLNFALRDG